VESKYLTTPELQRMEMASMKRQVMKRDVDIAEYKKLVYQQKAEIMILKYELMGRDVGDLKSKLSGFEDSHRQFVDSMKETYDIEGLFSYDPITGEIVEEASAIVSK